MKVRDILEARYYREDNYTLDDVNTAYQDAYDASMGSKIKMMRPEMYQSLSMISAELLIPNITNEDMATKAAKWFAKKFNMPYTDIGKGKPYLKAERFWKITILWSAPKDPT